MIVLATSASYVIPATVGAFASVLSAAVLAWVALRAQTAKDQLDEIQKLLDNFTDELEDRIDRDLRRLMDPHTRALVIGEIVAERMRQVLRERGLGRRYTDNDE